MAFVVTESCIRCVYTDCVSVCPTDCFRVGPNFMVIDPEDCIDCALCAPECPVNAIMQDDDLPQGQRRFIQINVDMSKKWPSITRKVEAPADADAWSTVEGKAQYLILD